MKPARDASVASFLHRELLYPRSYGWFIAASVLDIIMTTLVLRLGGFEANPVANAVIERFGMHGATAYKFALAVLVIVICEVVGRVDFRRGQTVARLAIAVPAFAATLGYLLIVRELGVPG